MIQRNLKAYIYRFYELVMKPSSGLSETKAMGLGERSTWMEVVETQKLKWTQNNADEDDIIRVKSINGKPNAGRVYIKLSFSDIIVSFIGYNKIRDGIDTPFWKRR